MQQISPKVFRHSHAPLLVVAGEVLFLSGWERLLLALHLTTPLSIARRRKPHCFI